MKKRVNKVLRGKKIEKLALEILKKRKYLVWKPPKVKFYSQDILGFFDIIALSKKDLKLIQVQKGRLRPYKVKKIFKLHKPKKISYEVWVYDPHLKNFRIYDKM
jgi:hypothetical protein